MFVLAWIAAEAAPRLDYAAVEGCPDAARFSDELSRVLGAPAFDPADPTAWRVRLATSGAGVLGTLETGDQTRVLEGPTCDEVFVALVAAAAGLQPAPTPAPSTSLPSLEAARAYRDRRLARGLLTGTVTVPSTVPIGGTTMLLPGSTTTVTTWVVYEGALPLRTRPFAELVRDDETLDRIRRRRSDGIGLLVLSGLSFGVGFGVALGVAADASSANDWLAPTTGIGGLGAMLGLGVTGATMIGRTNSFERTWGRDGVDRWIVPYNDRLQADLGLTDAQVLAIEGLSP